MASSPTRIGLNRFPGQGNLGAMYANGTGVLPQRPRRADAPRGRAMPGPPGGGLHPPEHRRRVFAGALRRLTAWLAGRPLEVRATVAA